jgi:hypothetical protein
MGRFRQKNTGNSWNMEAVFRPEIFQIFSENFRSVSDGKHRKLAEIHRKNPDNFRPEYYFHVLAISGVFLQDPVAGIFDLSY